MQELVTKNLGLNPYLNVFISSLCSSIQANDSFILHYLQLILTSTVLTKSGVQPWPRTIPSGKDIASAIVAVVLWLSGNQC